MFWYDSLGATPPPHLRPAKWWTGIPSCSHLSSRVCVSWTGSSQSAGRGGVCGGGELPGVWWLPGAGEGGGLPAHERANNIISCALGWALAGVGGRADAPGGVLLHRRLPPRPRLQRRRPPPPPPRSAPPEAPPMYGMYTIYIVEVGANFAVIPVMADIPMAPLTDFFSTHASYDPLAPLNHCRPPTGWVPVDFYRQYITPSQTSVGQPCVGTTHRGGVVRCHRCHQSSRIFVLVPF